MIIILLIGYFIIIEFNEKKKIEISNLYNSTVIQYSINSKEDIVDDLIDIINKMHQDKELQMRVYCIFLQVHKFL